MHRLVMRMRVSFCVLAVIGIVMSDQSRRISRGNRPVCLVTALFYSRAAGCNPRVVEISCLFEPHVMGAKFPIPYFSLDGLHLYFPVSSASLLVFSAG